MAREAKRVDGDAVPRPSETDARPTGSLGAFYHHYESPILYTIAVVTYIPFCIAFPRFLTWTYGPMWLLSVVWLIPAGVRRIARRG